MLPDVLLELGKVTQCDGLKQVHHSSAGEVKMPYVTFFPMTGAGLSMLAGAPVAAVLGGIPYGGQAGRGQKEEER